MASPAIQDFNQKFAQSPELQQQIAAVESVPQLMAVLQVWECNLTGPEIVTLAQAAYQCWLDALDPGIQPFFVEAHNNKTINQSIEQCKNPEDVVVLAANHGFQLTVADLERAAIAASQVEGFSFEKLWFKGLGLMP